MNGESENGTIKKSKKEPSSMMFQKDDEICEN
jgi:hypothetical protein